MTRRRPLAVSFEGDSIRARAASFCFGDRVGLACFLGTLCLFTVCWIVAWRINDSLTLLNTLHGMSEGQLHITSVEYGSSLATPGTHQIGDEIFGRNYGVLAVSLVPLVAFEALALVADLRIALVGLFSLGVLALAVTVGRIVRRERSAVLIGAGAALVTFAGNVAVATDLDPARSELYAVQVTHLVAGAFVVVFAYRLLATIHGRRTGLFAGALVALGTPVGLWASIPKRHVFTAAIGLLLAYALYRRSVCERAESGSGLKYRVGAYAAIGLFAWIHAPEALLLLLVFAAVDLPTARNDVRSLGAIVVGMGVATIPFLVTNYLLSGSPATPPRMLPSVGASTGEPSFAGGQGGDGGTGSGSFLAPVFGAVDPLLSPFVTLLSLFHEGLANVVFHPEEAWSTFVRSGYLQGFAEEANYESINLAVLEAAPLLGAVVGVVPVAIDAVRNDLAGRLAWPPTPARVVDAYLVLFVVAFSVLYLSRLPVHAQITVRYLLPIVPALVVLVVRLPAIRGVLSEHWRLLCWTYVVAVSIGGQLLIVALVLVDPGVGEAFQFHAWIGLVIAIPLAGWSLFGRHDGWWGRAGAVLIALASAAITVFLLLLTIEYFTVGNAQAIPLVRAVAEVVSFT